MSTRMVKVKKDDLIAKIKQNKAKHIEEYEQAIKDYHDEADKKLRKMRMDLKKGKTDLSFMMVQPVNKSDEYDKLVTQFEWEQEDYVYLTQAEFSKFVHDEHDFSVAARLSNLTYSKFK